MQKDLIDREALAEELSTLTMHITGLRAGKGVLNEFMQEYRKSALRIVEEAPAVDAVEVVRCKECTRKRKDGKAMRCPFSTVDLTPNGYCHHGMKHQDRRISSFYTQEFIDQVIGAKWDENQEHSADLQEE